MKSIYKLVLMGLFLIVIGCSGEVENIDLPIEEKVGKTIKFSATVADESLATRMTMEQDDLDVKFKWEVGDEIKLYFTDGEQSANSITTVTTVSNDGKRAEFEVVLPGETESPTFDLYGYYGGGTLSTVEGEEGYANLLPSPWGGTLPALEGADLVMLKFAATGIDVNEPEVSVSFQHVGSLFKIFLENTSSITLNGISNIEIFSEDVSGVIYAHQPVGTSAQYDLVTETFVSGTTTFTNQLSFIPVGVTESLAPSEVLELWGWYPPSQEAGHIWPELKLRLTHAGSPSPLVTVDLKSARTSTTAIGRAYHFYATYDGANLSFSDIVKRKLVDVRDNTQYNTVQIGSHTWMAENLKFYQAEKTVSLPDIESDIDPYYYVYNYTGDSNDEVSLQAFTLAGTLYNWAAALDGDTEGSGVRGICPEGWHLPSETEWVQLISSVGSDPGTKLKDQLWWGPGAGTNEFGFTARPGGIRNNDTIPYYSGLGTDGYWFVSDIVSSGTEMRVASISHDQSGVEFSNIPKEYAVSVRCVKD